MLLPMIVALCALSLSSVQGNFLNEGKDGMITIRNYQYKKELLVANIWAKKIDINKKNGNMYIVDIHSNLLLLKKGKNAIQSISIDDMSVNTIALDSSAGFLYIGGNNGLKIYNECTQLIQDVPDITEEILDIFVRNSIELYVVTVRGNKIYKYNSLDTEPTRLAITSSEIGFNNFVVDSNGNYYYNGMEEKSTRILLKSNYNKSVTYDGDAISFYMAVDNYGAVYGTAGIPHNSLYRLKSDGSIPEFIVKLDFIPVHMCFNENNDLVFATTTQIFILKLEENLQSCNTDLLQKIYKKVDLQSDNNTAIIALLQTVVANQEKITSKYNELLSEMNISETKNYQLEEKVNSLEKKIASVNGLGITNLHHLVYNETNRVVDIFIHNVGRVTVNSPAIKINTKETENFPNMQ